MAGYWWLAMFSLPGRSNPIPIFCSHTVWYKLDMYYERVNGKKAIRYPILIDITIHTVLVIWTDRLDIEYNTFKCKWTKTSVALPLPKMARSPLGSHRRRTSHSSLNRRRREVWGVRGGGGLITSAKTNATSWAGKLRINDLTCLTWELWKHFVSLLPNAISNAI